METCRDKMRDTGFQVVFRMTLVLHNNLFCYVYDMCICMYTCKIEVWNEIPVKIHSQEDIVRIYYKSVTFHAHMRSYKLGS